MGKTHLHAISKNGSLCNTYGKKLELTLYKSHVTCKLCKDMLGIPYHKWHKDLVNTLEGDIATQMEQAKVDFKDVMTPQVNWEKHIQNQQNLIQTNVVQAKLKPIHQVYAHHYKSPAVNRVNKIWKLKQAIVERNKIDVKIEEAKILAETNNITPYGGRTKRYACRPDCDICISRGLTY